MVAYIKKDIEINKPKIFKEPKDGESSGLKFDARSISIRMFQIEDEDGNGFISFDEFSGPKE